jgi:hypothetical protein
MYTGRHQKIVRSRQSIAACRYLVASLATQKLAKEKNLSDEEKQQLIKARDEFRDEGVRYQMTGFLCGDAVLFTY